MNQDQLVLKYILEFGYITTWEAFTELHITRLSAKIYNLKKMGYKFKTETISTKNRYGKKTHFTKYSLEEEQK